MDRRARCLPSAAGAGDDGGSEGLQGRRGLFGAKRPLWTHGDADADDPRQRSRVDFFTYKNGSEIAGTAWEETDIEVLGKNDAMSWQSNLITGNPRMTSEQVYTATSSLADGYHTYTLEWTPDYVLWLFDGTMVRKTEGGQASSLINPETLRFNAWASDASSWAGALDEAALPAYQFVNWIKYYRYDNGQFVLDWTDDFDSFDTNRWAAGNWTFDGNLVDFDPANAVVKDGTLILAITKEGATGFSGTVPVDDGSTNTDGGLTISKPGSDSGCAIGGALATGTGGLCGMLVALGLAAARGGRRSRLALRRPRVASDVRALEAGPDVGGAPLRRARPESRGGGAGCRALPHPGLLLWAVRSARPIRARRRRRQLILSLEGRLVFDDVLERARLREDQFRLPPADQHLDRQGNAERGDQHAFVQYLQRLPHVRVRMDAGLHRLVHRRRAGPEGDRRQRHRVHAERVPGMSIHFNIWQGDSSFGGNLSTSTLPVYQYVSWAQYSSYANGAFQMQWREDFTGSTTPSGWALGDWMPRSIIRSTTWPT